MKRKYLIINILFCLLFSNTVVADNEQEINSEPESTKVYVFNDTFENRDIIVGSYVTKDRFTYDNLNTKTGYITIPPFKTMPIEVSKPNITKLKQYPLDELKMRLSFGCSNFPSRTAPPLNFNPSSFGYLPAPFDNYLDFNINDGVGSEDNPINITDMYPDINDSNPSISFLL